MNYNLMPYSRILGIVAFAVTASTVAPAEEHAPDLEFKAKVRAREMVFEIITGAHVNFHGTPNRKTLWEVRRKNLPKPVQPGEVYRDVEVDAHATSTFENVSTADVKSPEK